MKEWERTAKPEGERRRREDNCHETRQLITVITLTSRYYFFISVWDGWYLLACSSHLYSPGNIRKGGSMKRLRKLGPKRWEAGWWLKGFDGAESQAQPKWQMEWARERKKPLDMKICKGRNTGMRGPTAGLRDGLSPGSNRLYPALHGQLEGSIHTPPLQ